jgi:3',5'-cyclic AMP phosphodiesterase CpdA
VGNMKRRSFLQTGSLLAAGSLLAGLPADSSAPSFRVAHLTDIHVKPGEIPEKGMENALRRVRSLTPGVDFLINGGDCIMDALGADRKSTDEQWATFHRILNKENNLPVRHVTGNHDIWGWFLKDESAISDPLYGKEMTRRQYGLSSLHYFFDHGKWRFIVLDSTQLNPAGGYIARIDDPQLNWLKQTLEQTTAGKYVCIVSHIPVLSICAGLFFEKTEENGDRLLKRNLMHSDFIALKKIFLQYPQVKTCLSGHIHLQDEVDYLGVRYYCNGAVSGNWWKGKFQEFEPAFAVMEFFEDGTTRRTMINY